MESGGVDVAWFDAANMPQQIQLFSPESAHGGTSSAWTDPPLGFGNPSRSLSYLVYIAATVGGLLVLGVLAYPLRAIEMALIAVGAIALPWGIYCTSQKPSRLVIVLILVETATASALVATSGSNLGALIRCPVEFLFCLPFFWSVWRSGILGEGGFRDYKIYFICALLSAIYSLAPEVSIGRALAGILPLIALCAIAQQIHSAEDAKQLMGVLSAACGVVVVINFMALVIAPAGTAWYPDLETGMLRFTGIFTEPNEVGALAMATIGAGFGYWSIAKGWKRALTASAMIGSAILAVLADSRSPLAAIAIGIAVYIVSHYRLRGAVAVVALFLVVHTALALLPGTQSYVNRGDVASFTGRQDAWDFAITSIKERPLIGYGYGIEGEILQSPYFASWDEVWNMGYRSSLHNGYLSRAISLGIPGLLFWLFLIVRPTASAFLPGRDPFSLRSVVCLSMLPPLIMNFTESLSDLSSFAGVEMAVVWMLLERQRLLSRPKKGDERDIPERPKSDLVRALQA